MKLKRVKTIKKRLKFYELNFGFRKPHQLLVDATLAQAALVGRINLKDQIPHYFGDEFVLVTTKCIVYEAKNLGPQLNGAYKILSQFKIWGCSHSTPISASECIKSVVGTNNHNHIILASQDCELKRELNDKFVPFVHVYNHIILLEKPPQHTLDYIQQKTFSKRKTLKEIPTNVKKSKKKRPLVRNKWHKKGINYRNVQITRLGKKIINLQTNRS